MSNGIDLFVVCKNSNVQIWLNQKQQGYIFHSELELPSGAGHVSFSDIGMYPITLIFIDGDGDMDMIFPSCETSLFSKKKCFINIAYNIQRPLCQWNKEDGCRLIQNLCSADDLFSFTFDVHSGVILMRFIFSNLAKFQWRNFSLPL
jgi:integrin alpha FG-GAP repeat containing protein 1